MTKRCAAIKVNEPGRVVCPHCRAFLFRAEQPIQPEKEGYAIVLEIMCPNKRCRRQLEIAVIGGPDNDVRSDIAKDLRDQGVKYSEINATK